MGLPRIGSQLFINRTDSPKQARVWVDQMDAVGLKVIRLFMLWDLVEPRKDQWTWEVFDAVFDQAEKITWGGTNFMVFDFSGLDASCTFTSRDRRSHR